MSTCAVFFVLFKAPPTSVRLKELEAIIANRTAGGIAGLVESVYGRLKPVEDADLVADITEDSSLHYLHKERPAPLVGVLSIQDRLHILDPLVRWWAPDSPEGPAMEFVITILVLLAQKDIGGVWYGDEHYQDGVTIPAMTKSDALRMLDEFIQVGVRDE